MFLIMMIRFLLIWVNGRRKSHQKCSTIGLKKAVKNANIKTRTFQDRDWKLEQVESIVVFRKVTFHILTSCQKYSINVLGYAIRQLPKRYSAFIANCFRKTKNKALLLEKDSTIGEMLDPVYLSTKNLRDTMLQCWNWSKWNLANRELTLTWSKIIELNSNIGSLFSSESSK